MKNTFLSLVFSLLVFSLFAQKSVFWNNDRTGELALETTTESSIFPETRRAFTLDFQSLKLNLQNEAPQEFSGQKGLILDLPMPNGDNDQFEMFYSPVVESGFQEKYPHIRSYKGFNINKPQEIVRMTISQLGLKASILSNEGEIYIDPFVEGQTSLHAVYYVKDYDPILLQEAFPACGTESIFEDSALSGLELEGSPSDPMTLRSAGEPISLHIFRAGIATTGDWTLAEGGKDNAVAKVVACIDRGNQVFENEVGFRLVLAANNDRVVFDNPQTDPYPGSEPKSGRELIGQNTSVLNLRLGQSAYDIGHVFTNRCSDVGGVASLASVCGNNKGSGTTCWYNRNLDYTVVRIMCHEMGHQFSAPHTFNNCGGNESFGTGYEPGSGSTIMSYGGLCGSNNVVSGAEAARDIVYYHANSAMRMFTFARSLDCAGEIATNNTRPDAILDYQDGFAIPISTPFYLEGQSIDMEGDNVTYCFEQHDFGSNSCGLGNPTGTCPMFRSFLPRTEDYRVFPDFNIVWNNQIATSRNEVLVDYSREMNFVLTVRDNNAEVGAWGMDTTTFDITAVAGPFLVSHPNNGEDQIAGDYIEVTWDVSNTDIAPVNCKYVDILLQLNNNWGNTEVLKSQTANDGSEWVFIPEVERNNVRILVRASDNIFFDISNRSFDIDEASTPGYSLGLSPNSARLCLPDVFTTEILTSAYGGYSGNLDLDVVDGLPAGATYAFGKSVIEASENTTLTIDMTNVTDRNDAVITMRAISENGDTLYREINLDIVSNDYSLLTTEGPADGAQGVMQSPDFSWPVITDADFYNVQLASNPSFDPGTIIEEWTGVTSTSVTVSDLLEKNTIYFWRVQGVNVCGEGEYTVPAAFSTEAASCGVYEAPDRGLKLQKGATQEFNLNIFQNAEINDLNVSKFDFFCDFLQDGIVSLVSPTGTEVLLMDRRCGNTTTALCAFDDDAGTRIKCPPLNGKAYRPDGSLSDFNGESAAGQWRLKIEILSSAVSAELGGWELEICSNSILEAPVLIINDTMKTRPAENNPIRQTILLCEDNNNTALELEYTLSTTPNMGEILLNGGKVNLGSSFTQADLDAGNVTYNNTAGEEGIDQFIFTVNDGEGGWTGSHTFTIELDDDFASSVINFSDASFFKLYPNPNDGRFTVLLEDYAKENVTIQITDLKGQLIQSNQINTGHRSKTLMMNDLSSGLYLIKVINANIQYTEKVIIRSRD